MSRWRRAWTWDRSRFVVEGNWLADATWLEHFLQPWFERATPEGPCHLEFHRSAAKYEELRQEMSAEARVPLPCFSLDSQVVTCPGWTSGSQTTAFYETLRCFISRRNGHLAVIAGPENLYPRLALVRVLRELLWSESSEWLAVHASVVEWQGSALVFAGPKKAGKTTLLSYLLQKPGSRLVANDWTMLKATELGVIARGVPTVVRVRPGTLNLLPNVQFKTASHWLHGPGCGDLATASSPEGEAHLSPSTLAACLDSEPLAQALVGAIVIPHQATEGPCLELSQRAEFSNLDDILYGQPGFRPANSFLTQEREAKRTDYSPLDAIPKYDLKLSADAFTNHDAASRILSLLKVDEPAARS